MCYVAVGDAITAGGSAEPVGQQECNNSGELVCVVVVVVVVVCVVQLVDNIVCTNA